LSSNATTLSGEILQVTKTSPRIQKERVPSPLNTAKIALHTSTSSSGSASALDIVGTQKKPLYAPGPLPADSESSISDRSDLDQPKKAGSQVLYAFGPQEHDEPPAVEEPEKKQEGSLKKQEGSLKGQEGSLKGSRYHFRPIVKSKSADRIGDKSRLSVPTEESAPSILSQSSIERDFSDSESDSYSSSQQDDEDSLVFQPKYLETTIVKDWNGGTFLQNCF
jgi:hypothetical protein